MILRHLVAVWRVLSSVHTDGGSKLNREIIIEIWQQASLKDGQRITVNSIPQQLPDSLKLLNSSERRCRIYQPGKYLKCSRWMVFDGDWYRFGPRT